MNPNPNSEPIDNPVQTPNLNVGQNHRPQTEEDPPPDPAVALSNHTVQSPAEVQTHPAMNPVNLSVASPGSVVPNHPKDQNPNLNKHLTKGHSPHLDNDSTRSPGSAPSEVSYPVQVKNLDPNQTIVLTKPADPDKSPAQSITVRVPAMALLKALVKNTGQTHVRIPLQTQQGPGAVLVPSTVPSNIHLTASVQSLLQHPGLVQNNVRSPGIILSPVRNSRPVPSPVRYPGPVPNQIRSPSLVQNRVLVSSSSSNLRNPVPNLVRSPGLAQKLIRMASPTLALVQTKTLMTNPVQTKTPVPHPVKTKSSLTSPAWAPHKDKPAESNSGPGLDAGLDPDLVPVPLPPEAVRALSPPPKTTPLKPSVPPLGFRLNGKFITLLPGAESLKMSLCAHPSGSKTRLTSVHLTKDPAPIVFPTRPSIRLPRPSVTVSGESTLKPLKKTPPSLPVKIQKIHPPPKSKPRPHVTLPRPHVTLPEKSKAAIAAALLQKGGVVRRRPPDCTVCKSHFTPVPELRGFACMCSSDVSSALQILKLRRKDERVKSRLKRKLNVLNQQQRVCKPRHFHSYPASKSLSSLQKPLSASEPFLSEPCPSVSAGVPRARPTPCPSAPRPRPSPSPSVPRPRTSPSPGVPRPRTSPSPGVPRPRTSPSPGAPVRSEVSSPCSGTEVTVGGAVGRLVIHLEDFYYGSAEGEVAVEQVRLVTTYRCMHCTQVLPNNIRMMQHSWDHMVEFYRGSCSHCFRQFFSSAKLQHHLKVVHGPKSSSSGAVCQICEFDFETEVSLLLHMKEMHKPGEMPYACGLCGFRSSFFTQTWRHFEKVHADTRHFLCPYCLRVFKMDRTFQQHVARHLRKQVYSCDRCRLHFHVFKDRQDHQEQHHGTHVRPAQLSGLRPGTTVSVRTFKVAPPESPAQRKPGAAISDIVHKTQPKLQKVYKRKAVESLEQLYTQLHSSECSRCVECLCRFQDFKSHFPTRVTCSRCRFETCCSRTYANHMINNHSGKRNRPLYPQVFTSCPRSDCSLECLTCGFSCQTGDVMALHLSKNTKHTCLLTEGAEDELYHHAVSFTSEQSLFGGSGGFISIEYLSSSHLSIATLDRPTHLSSPAAMTITVRGPTDTLPKPAAPLSVSRLSALLHSLLHGAVSASKLFGISQTLIGRWAREQRKSLTIRRWRWDTMGGARWVLTEREKNRIVTKDAILDLSHRTLGPKTSYQTRLNWAVDFLLRHDLGLETRSKELRDMGYSVVTSTWDKVNSLLLLPSRFCCLDEFPVFMDPGALSSLTTDVLRVWGHREELPLVEVLLCGTSDGSLLPPMMFYNKDLPPLPHGFPTNIILQGREGGYSLEERAQLWADKVWHPHLVDSSPSLLLLDEHCGHMTLDFKKPLLRSCTELVHIPQGCGFLVQPLDQCVAPVVREFLKVRWSQLISQSPDFSESDLVLTLACWFSEVCHILNRNKDFMHRSFLCVGTRYKTAEVTHHTLYQSLHQALIQTAPSVSATSQSEVAEERHEEGLKTERQSENRQEHLKMEVDQSEPPTQTWEVGLRPENQSYLEEKVIEPEVMEVDHSEGQEGTEETGQQLEGQSEAHKETEETGQQPEGQSEAHKETEETGQEPEGQSEAHKETEETGQEPEGQSEAHKETEETGQQLEG